MAPTLPLLLRPLYEALHGAVEPEDTPDPAENDSTSEAEKKLENVIKEMIVDYVGQISPQVTAAVSDILFAQRVEFAAHRARLWRRWGPGLKILSVIGQLAVETGAEVNALAQRAGKTGPMLTALSSIHARGCQVFQEILVLLRNGFAEGADARWRTLHELSVTAVFIAQNGQTVAERYLDHDTIEVARGSAEYEEWHRRLGFKPLGDASVSQAKEAAKRLIEKYGESFGSSYGWACCVLGSTKRLGIQDLEEAIKLDHWRPMYRGASHSVHASPRRVFFSVTQPDDQPPMLAVGPSNYGLADPGQNAALSLAQLTSAFMLFTLEDSPIDLSIVLGIMCKLADMAAATLVDIHTKLEQEIREDGPAQE